jgi:TRAP-type mannitol/chloroaromatic compound transport system permease small subunit
MEPITTAIMVVQGVSTIIKAVKAAAEETTDAFNKINECVELSGKAEKET